MKHLIAIIGLLTFTVSCGVKNIDSKETKIVAGFEEGTENTLLWQVTSKDQKDTSFLFGTMHLINKEYYYFPDNLTELIKTSDAIVMEIVGDPNPLAMMKLMMLEEGELFDYFNEEQQDSILVWAKEVMNTNAETFKMSFGKMKPFVISMLAAQKSMMEDAESYEMTITEIMKENDIEGIGLETAEEQMGIFDDFTDEEQAQMVMEAIKDDPKAEELTLKMQQIYSRQNIDSLHLLIQEEGGTVASKENELLNNRNDRWIPLIEDIIKEKRAFIAVGAGHLGGENGVLELLRKEGYTITPVKL
jgi:uncharacterized protein YbaP (TraB family)